MKWLLLIVAAVLVSLYVVYAALHALNGIVYEAKLMRTVIEDERA